VGSACHGFFGFNGTAGVWRVHALADAGGWKDRTTVEDMDLAVRASMRGWKFVFTGDVMVRNELPSTFKAYRYQQHQWSCGPANLMRKMFWEIVTSRQVCVGLEEAPPVLYGFFFVRKVVAHLFLFYRVVIPVYVLVQGDMREALAVRARQTHACMHSFFVPPGRTSDTRASNACKKRGGA
jgi:beta-mannan synthase